MGSDSDSDWESDEDTKKPEAVRAWRGLAHYRTHMKRIALQRNFETRTTSDLYLLEDIVNDVKFICDLPMALRLNILWWATSDRFANILDMSYITLVIELLNKEAKRSISPSYSRDLSSASITNWECKKLKLGSFLLVNGSAIECSKTGTLPAMKHDLAPSALREDYHEEHDIVECREYSIDTNEKTELLTLTRRDYERVLNIKKTPELRERVSFLKGIERFKGVPRQSLLRLANVLSSRTYSKNRIITFQGDDAVEMYFVKSGECRIILEVPNEKLYTPLPRASSFLKQYWPTQYHRCRMDDKDKQKDWWHPSFEKPRESMLRPRQKLQGPLASRCNSSYTGELPKGLGAAVLRNPDAVFGLVKRRKSNRKSKKEREAIKRRQSEITPIAAAPKPPKPARRKSRASTSAPAGAAAGAESRRKSDLEKIPIGGLGEIREHEVPGSERPSEWGSPRGSIEAMHISGTLGLSDKTTPPFPTAMRDVAHWPFVGGVPQSPKPAGRYSLLQIHFTDVYGEKRPKKKSYSLRLFLHDCHRKEREAKMAEFGEKEHRLWQMGLRGENMMPGIVGEGNAYYKAKFEKWARYIIDREKKLLSNSEVEGSGEQSFMPGIATSVMMKLKKGRGQDGRPQYVPPKHQETSSILDIGCFKAGDFFGERGLITQLKRAASIVAVTTVETLVLTKWDFHRHCDRQVIRVFKATEYQKQRRMFRNYQRTRKWERYKRKVSNEVFEAKYRRFNVGPRPIRVLPNPNRTKHELPAKEWLFKSHPTVLPSFPNQDPFALMRQTMEKP